MPSCATVILPLGLLGQLPGLGSGSIAIPELQSSAVSSRGARYIQAPAARAFDELEEAVAE